MQENNSLKGWSIAGGNANYKIEDGIIIGESVENSPNSFLVSDSVYDDFILELDFKADSMMNSGIQIRSKIDKNYKSGIVHGYQVEIDPSERSWSGGLYEEQGRGWLYSLSENIEAKNAFKNNDWNHFRIEAIGDTIKTWINGIAASHLIDEKTNEGFIALQVHAIDKNTKKNQLVRWKNIRIITENPIKYAEKSNLNPINTKNALTSEEIKQGWEMLWNGKTTEGWRGAKLAAFPENGWTIADGELSVISSGGAESAAGGDIVTIKCYANFELKLDFKLTAGANSGIKYYVDTEINKGPGSSIGLEYQILDDDLHEDAKLGSHEGSRTIGSLYDLIKADPNKPVNPIGKWNSAYIFSRNNHVEHWINGVKILEYERGSPAFLKLVSESKYAQWEDFGLHEKGQILLQDHGDAVSFKNIKIRDLDCVIESY